jgi:hypothetical protein
MNVRVLYKSWGSGLFECDDASWGWDSLSWRVRAGELLGGDIDPGFRLATILGPESAWIAFRKGYVVGFGTPNFDGDEDSVRISTRPVEFHSATYDAGTIWRVMIWQPSAKPNQSVTHSDIHGRVVDDSTNAGIPEAHVLLLGTHLEANTDRDGRFVIHDAPSNRSMIKTCSYFHHLPDTRWIPAGRRDIEIRLHRKSAFKSGP